MVPEQQLIDAINQRGFGCRVSFHWHRDRFGHTIGLVHGERHIPLLASREGTNDEHWPDSPVLQSLNAQIRNDGRQVGLLVGMAGSNHWSASVEANVGRTSLHFDVACRSKSSLEFVGSRYRTMLDPIHVNSDRLDWNVSGYGCQLRLEPIDGHPLPRLEATVDGLSISAAPHRPTCPTTIRWRYAVEWKDE